MENVTARVKDQLILFYAYMPIRMNMPMEKPIDLFCMIKLHPYPFTHAYGGKGIY